MKICPKCGDYVLYDDDIRSCPNCGSVLVPWEVLSAGDEHTEPIRPVEGGEMDGEDDKSFAEPFETIEGNKRIINGRVVEVNTQTRVHNRVKKIINAVFRGEPYQFGHTTHETVLRVTENTQHRFPDKSRDVFFYGDVEGRFVVGDEIRTVVKEVRDRLVVLEMKNKTTRSTVKPAAQLPAAFLIILLALFLATVLAIVWLFASGKIINLLGIAIGGLLGVILSVFVALAPLLIIVWIFRAMLR